MSANNVQVIERLLSRKNNKKDKYKIGLIIEGGGMRGAFAGGVMAGLEKLGLTDCFDYIYASSSGSCAGAYFLTHQTGLGTSIYFEDLNGYKFIKPWKINRAADIDYLCDVLFRHKRKLDTNRLAKSKTIFKIFVADADSGECTYYTNKDKVDPIKAIKASCALPIFYNRSVEIGQEKHMDGRIGKAIPIEDALSDNCTDILVVTTVPKYFRVSKDRIVISWLKKILMSNLSKEYKKKYYDQDKYANYNESLDVVFGKIKVARPVNIFTISPEYMLDKFETRRGTLKRAVNHGIFRAMEAFSLAKK